MTCEYCKQIWINLESFGTYKNKYTNALDDLCIGFNSITNSYRFVVKSALLNAPDIWCFDRKWEFKEIHYCPMCGRELKEVVK
jgi:hypothetical protein